MAKSKAANNEFTLRLERYKEIRVKRLDKAVAEELVRDFHLFKLSIVWMES
jgi:hypothetical protein